MLDRLEVGRQALKANMAKRNSPLSALRRVPAETWETIFDLVCSADDSYSLAIDPHRAVVTALPIALSHVCSLWRDIIANLPWAWSSINIVFCHTLSQNHISILEIFLERSRGYPLTLRIERSVDHCDLPSQFEEAGWKILANHLSRTQDLSLGGGYLCNLLEIPLVENQDVLFPVLTTYASDPGRLNETHPWWKALYAAPLLRTVSSSILPDLSSLPYHQLTSLSLDLPESVMLGGLTHMLPACSALDVLVLKCVGPGLGVMDDFIPFESRSLRTLSIEDSSSVDVDSPILKGFLESSRLPSLEKFVLGCADLSVNEGWPPCLLEMLERCSASLRTFAIGLSRQWYPVTNRYRTLAGSLERTPNLTFLEFKAGWYGELRDHRCIYNGSSSRQPPQDLDFNNSLVTHLFQALGKPDRVLVPNLSAISISVSDIVFDELWDAVFDTAMLRTPTNLTLSPFQRPLTSISLSHMPAHTLT
ncbi:hypothetical protein V5O48_010698 [Marasmius crinis-equi]|uniref:F-box domain-containing protein n=1 Tax=Marasmius crinis-equi TaxID=585013 RepID=A0ABR3F7M5_9AGAR